MYCHSIEYDLHDSAFSNYKKHIHKIVSLMPHAFVSFICFLHHINHTHGFIYILNAYTFFFICFLSYKSYLEDLNI